MDISDTNYINSANRISCCGVICSECENFFDCGGCEKIEGKPYWLQFTGEKVCSIYDCCISEKALSHCGKCSLLPCPHYLKDDPTKTAEENARILEKQLELLKTLD